MMPTDPVEEFRRLCELRDARHDSALDPELTAILTATSKELVAVLRQCCSRIDSLPDDDPGKRARRAAETAWLTSLIQAMGGTQ
jgi:hypothetical protein